MLINYDLARERNLSKDDIVTIELLHSIREAIEEDMSKEDDPYTLKELFEEWTENQFALQEAWGFPLDKKFHRFWTVPKCTCPKMDNEDAYPVGYYVLVQDCPVHGWELLVA